MYMNTPVYLHVYTFLPARVAVLTMCSRSFLSTEWKTHVQNCSLLAGFMVI